MRREVFAREAAEFVRVRRSFVGALRSCGGGADIDARGAEVPSGEYVALCGNITGTRSDFAGRGDDAGDSCATAGRADGSRRVVRQGRGAESYRIVQGARAIGGGDTRERTGREDACHSNGGECRRSAGGVCGGRGDSVRDRDAGRYAE